MTKSFAARGSKTSQIRSELAKNINRSAKEVALLADTSPQYVNFVRRKLKKQLLKAPIPKPFDQAKDRARDNWKDLASDREAARRAREAMEAILRAQHARRRAIVATAIGGAAGLLAICGYFFAR